MRRLLRWGVYTLLPFALLGCSTATGPVDPFVSLAEINPSIIITMRYQGYENFVGTPVDGYRENLCLLTPEAARALDGVQRQLNGIGLGLIVYDCYRPQQAVDHFVRWASDLDDNRTKVRYFPNEPKSQMFERGYIARRSGHSRGSTVDVALVRLGAGARYQLLDMGSPWDFFDPRSATAFADLMVEQKYHRRLLLMAMTAEGFVNYDKEWWHYTLKSEPYPETYFDLPVARP